MNSKQDILLIQTKNHNYLIEKHAANNYIIARKDGSLRELIIYMPSTNSWHFAQDSKLSPDEQQQISESMESLGQAKGWGI